MEINSESHVERSSGREKLEKNWVKFRGLAEILPQEKANNIKLYRCLWVIISKS